MKIIVLGSGPCVAIPRKGCRCKTCSHARKPKSKSKRLRSSILIKKNRFNLLVDCSPDFLEQVKCEKIKKIDAVILTHLHADAAGGLGQLDRWTKKEIPVYTERVNFKKIKKYKNLKLNEIKLNQTMKIGMFRVAGYRVEHGLTPGFPTVGYRIDNKLGYISDAGKIPKKNINNFKYLKLLFLDGAIWFGKKMKGHLNTGEAIELIKILKPGKAILTQIGHGYPPYHQAMREIKKQGGKNIALGYDGMKLSI